MGIDTTITGMIQRMVDTALLGVKPIERWSALRQLSGTSASEHSGEGMLLAAVAVLMLLTLLLWWVSSKRKGHGDSVRREFFAESAGRRGLSARERQILLAVVVRSGLGQSEDIFTAVDAFDRGSARLREECSRTRTAEENESLRTEIAWLRSKLGFESARSQRGPSPAKRPSSRDIPVGQIIEMTRRQRDGSSVHAEVIRNDDIELMVELPHELEIHAGDNWLARYDFGTSFWEFDTTAVRCEGTRLVLSHSDHVRFVNRRRFPRVAVHIPALVAPLPLMKNSVPAWPGAEAHTGPDREPLGLEPPLFVRGVVTEMAGPGLRIEVPMPVSAGDRVLVMFQPDGAFYRAGSRTPPAGGGYVVSDIGRVQYVQKVGEGVSMGVELGGLSEGDVDRLAHLAHTLQSHTDTGSAGSDPAVSAATESHATAAEGTA